VVDCVVSRGRRLNHRCVDCFRTSATLRPVRTIIGTSYLLPLHSSRFTVLFLYLVTVLAGLTIHVNSGKVAGHAVVLGRWKLGASPFSDSAHDASPLLLPHAKESNDRSCSIFYPYESHIFTVYSYARHDTSARDGLRNGFRVR
jgi:hypothetical protein